MSLPPPPHPFLLSLLPFLFSPDTLSIPPQLLSSHTLQSIHYLSLTEQDARYYTLGSKDSEVELARREIVESGSFESLILGEARYSFDSTEFKSLISISLPSYSTPSSPPTPLLNVILIYEEPSSSPPSTISEAEQTREEASWCFLRLEGAGSGSPGNGFDALRAGGISSSSTSTSTGGGGEVKLKWFKSLEEAVESTKPPTTTSQTTTTKNRPSPMDFHSHHLHESNSNSEDYDEYGTRRPLTEHENGKSVKQMKTREEMVQGEGTTPGAYGDSADFWAGWSDSEGEEEEEEEMGGGLEKGRGRDTEKEDEENYWRNYGSVEDQVSNGREEEDVQSPTIPQLEQAKPLQTQSTPPQPQPNLAKTRSRRSSTVTPFSPKAFLSTPPPSTTQPAQNSQSSFLSMQDSPASTSQPFQPLAPHPSSAAPTTNGASDGKGLEKEDEYLRFALAGVWGMFGRGSLTEREEKKKRFERIVGEVLRS